MFRIIIPEDWWRRASKGIQLLPEPRTGTVRVPLHFLPDGRWDRRRFLTHLGREVRRALGLRVDFHGWARSDPGLVRQIQAAIVEQVIRQLPDVLAEFRLDHEALKAPGQEQAGNLPLRLETSGYRLQVTWRPGRDGRPDASLLAGELARAWREVFFLEADQEVFSPSQVREVAQRGKRWLYRLGLEAGLVAPRVELDTTSAAWVEGCLRLWVSVEGRGAWRLMVPVAQGGEPDYAGVSRLALRIGRWWARRAGLARSDGVCARIEAELLPQVRCYVEWIIAQEREVRQQFWRELLAELKRRLARVEALEKEVLRIRREWEARGRRGELVRVTLRERLARADGPVAWLEVVATQVLEDLGRSMKTVARELPKLPGAVEKGFSPHAGEIMKALLFGAKAAGVVLKETSIRVMLDAGLAVIGAYSPLTLKDLFNGRLLACTILANNLMDAKETAEKIDRKLRKIKSQLYPEEPNRKGTGGERRCKPIAF